MKALEVLLNERWIIKSDSPELYYQVKDSLKEIKKFFQEKLGYAIIVNPRVIKLEKIPGHVEPWMGILEFTDIKEYQMFCYILMYLEDKEMGQQFVLSNITEFIQTQFDGDEIDWTVFTTRRQLIRVIKYCTSVGMIKQTDGEEEAFSRNVDAEVLYENTGVSWYFLRLFSTDIMEFTKPEDFQQSSWFDADEDRGVIRRHRVYRRLLLSPGMYRNDDKNDDFSYIRNYRYQIEKDFQSILPCDLHIHSSSAFLVLEDMRYVGRIFPKNNAMDEAIAYMFTLLQEKIKAEPLLSNEQYLMDEEAFYQCMLEGVKEIHRYLPKSYRIKEKGVLTTQIIDQMKLYGFIESTKNGILIYPVVGKLAGKFVEIEVKK